MSDYRLITGDAGQVLDRLINEGIKVDMVYTSPNPPFYTRESSDERENNTPLNLGRETNFIEYVNRLMEVFEKVRAILKDDGSFWLHAGDYSLSSKGRLQVPDRLSLHMIDKYNWILNSKLIWFRPEEYKANKRVRFKMDYEFIYWFTKIKEVPIYDNSYLETSIIEARYTEPPKGVWGSGFPEKLIEIPIKTCTLPGQTILDPFMGTGETGLIANNMKRCFIGIELFPWKTGLTLDRFRAQK